MRGSVEPDETKAEGRLAWQAALRRQEDRWHPTYDLLFDGKQLALRENGGVIARWPAMSGRAETQGGIYQSYADNGPIPQGKYEFKVSELQRYEDSRLRDRMLAPFDRGAWRGGPVAWGRRRFWLTPKEGTRTFGRDGFSIHGGTFPGSAGCIDLTDEMDEFTELMQAIGQDVIEVEVDHGWPGAPNHRRR